MKTTTARPTEPLRDEHRELLPRVEALRAAADGIGVASRHGTLAAIDDALAFLQNDLLPHAEAEEAALYPLVERVMGAPGATDTMRADHARIGGLIAELADARARANDDVSLADVRRLLYGLQAIVALHFSKEEEVYLPMLDRALTVDAAHEFFETLEAAALDAKARRRVE